MDFTRLQRHTASRDSEAWLLRARKDEDELCVLTDSLAPSRAPMDSVEGTFLLWVSRLIFLNNLLMHMPQAHGEE